MTGQTTVCSFRSVTQQNRESEFSLPIAMANATMMIISPAATTPSSARMGFLGSSATTMNINVLRTTPSSAFLPPHIRRSSPHCPAHHARHLRGRLPSPARASSESGAIGSRPTVGFLGLGIMGFAMARNLIKAGYDVTVWNRTGSKCDALVKEGAKYGSSPQQTAAACDITFAMLADPAAAIAIVSGEAGAAKGLGPDKGYIDVSTVDGETAKSIAESVKSTGAQYLEAPVSGSKKPAEDGALIFLAAGDQALYDRASPILDVMGKSRFYLGEVGKGAAMKLVVNMMMGCMMASFSEGLLLGSKAGLDPETIVKVVGEGTINAPMFQLKGPAMVKGAYPPAFPLKHQQKDLRLVLAMAEEVAQSIPIAACANELYIRAQTEGLGDSDFSAVMEALKL